MTIGEQINKLYFQETESALNNIDECQITDNFVSNICDVLLKFDIDDEDLGSNIESLMRIASSFFTLGTLYFIDQLRKG